MPKDQKLSVEQQIIKRLTAPGPQLRAAEQRARRQQAARRVIRDIEDFQTGRRNPIIEIFENMAGKYEDGGEAKNKPGSTFKPMDMGGDILNSYLAGMGNSKDTTVKGGGKKPKPKKMAKGGCVSPRKAQGMMYGGDVRKKKR